MKISNNSLFFDDEVIKHYPLKWDTDFRQIALFLRNNDIELDYIIDYLKKGDVDVDRYKYLCKFPFLPIDISEEEIERLKDKVLQKSKEYPNNFFQFMEDQYKKGKNLWIAFSALL